MTCQTYLIYSPVNDQSLVIAALLRKYFPNSHVIGVCLRSNTKPIGRKYYHKILTVDDIEPTQVTGVEIPTGAFATKYLLERGNVSLGSVVLTQPMLQVFDKHWLVTQAKNAGLLIPETWQTLKDVKTFPFFYKQLYEQGGGVRGIALRREDVPKEEKGNLIFQELIKSSGTYGVSFLAAQGKVLVTHSHFERESIPKVGGSAVFIEQFEDARLFDHTTRLVRYINYSGWGLAEFKYCPCRKDYVFMEINAKFWASCEFSFVNEPLFLKLLFNINSIENATKKVFFVPRALLRGPIFGDVKVCNYSRWLRALFFCFIPYEIYRSLKKNLLDDRR